MKEEICKSKKNLIKNLIILLILMLFIIVCLVTVVLRLTLGGEEIVDQLVRKRVYAEMEANERSAELLEGTQTDESVTENAAIGARTVISDAWNQDTVNAISVGNGDKVPVPKGFYYVGGDLNTGVIISDDQADEYDGTTDKTTWAYTTSLVGNQFVWIPCTETEYKKCSVWNGTAQAYTYGGWDTTVKGAELAQIRTYGGFYVARYEAGLADTITEFTSTQKHTGSNQVYNVSGKPQSKAGIVPWNFIDWNTSKANAESMYNTDSVSSGIISGTQWDVMLNKMVEKTSLTDADLTSSGSWGNYMNNSISYTGRVSQMTYSSGYWYQYAFGSVNSGTTTTYSSNNAQLLTTGASSQTECYHIFDVAGNLWEWTEECSLYHKSSSQSTAQYRVLRGGSCEDEYTTDPACYRYGIFTFTYTAFIFGYREALYIK